METINDIVAEMRIGDLCAEDTSASRPEFINDFLASFADRIEAAWKREVETTTDESSAVGNAGTVREIAQEMLNTSMQAVTAERINGWATRLADACKQSVTDCNQLGNTAKMREALEKIASMGEQIDYQLGSSEETVYALKHERCLAHNISECARSALSAPPRNCDVGTAEEQSERYEKFCYAHRSREKGCGDCPLCDIPCCEFAWLQMPYEEGGAR